MHGVGVVRGREVRMRSARCGGGMMMKMGHGVDEVRGRVCILEPRVVGVTGVRGVATRVDTCLLLAIPIAMLMLGAEGNGEVGEEGGPVAVAVAVPGAKDALVWQRTVAVGPREVEGSRSRLNRMALASLGVEAGAGAVAVVGAVADVNVAQAEAVVAVGGGVVAGGEIVAAIVLRLVMAQGGVVGGILSRDRLVQWLLITTLTSSPDTATGRGGNGFGHLGLSPQNVTKVLREGMGGGEIG